MVNFNDVKGVCKLHDQCLEKTKIIQDTVANGLWLKIVNQNGKEFYLESDEITALSECISKKSIAMETRVQEIFSSNTPI